MDVAKNFREMRIKRKRREEMEGRIE